MDSFRDVTTGQLPGVSLWCVTFKLMAAEGCFTAGRCVLRVGNGPGVAHSPRLGQGHMSDFYLHLINRNGVTWPPHRTYLPAVGAGERITLFGPTAILFKIGVLLGRKKGDG